MKKILAFIIGASILFSSCQDWLEVGSETELTEKDAFSDDSGFHKALTGIYIGMGDEALYGGMLTWRMLDYYAHYYYNVAGSDDAQFHAHNYKNAYVAGHISNIWNGLYNLIANCNNALEHLDEKQDELDPLGAQLIKGELLTLRAFLHFDLLRLFGCGDYANRVGELSNKLTIPYVTQFSKEIPAQSTYADVFKALKKDLNEAIALLWGENGENCYRYSSALEGFDYAPFERANGNSRWFFDLFDYETKPRIDYYVAKSILARVLLWEGDAANYQTILDIVEEWTLSADDSGSDNWDWMWGSLLTTSELYRDRIFAHEAVWHLNVNNLYKKIGEGSWFTDATQYEKILLYKNVANEIYEYESGNNIGANDWRRAYLLSATGNVYEIQKLNQVHGDKNYKYKDIMPMIGSAELYYMAAEVSLKSGNKEAACTYLNTVRNARGITTDFDLNYEELSDTEIMAEIQKEARKEFLCLGQMFYFYKRLGVKNIPNYENMEMTDELYVLPYPDEEVINGNRVQ